MVLNRNLLAHYRQMENSNCRLDIHAQNILVGMVCTVLAGMALGMVLVRMALGMASEHMALGTVLVRMALEHMASDILLVHKIVRFLSLLQMQIALTTRSNP